MKTGRNMQCLANHNPLHVASQFLPWQYNIKLNKDARSSFMRAPYFSYGENDCKMSMK
jgi:hypothetical protein